ncbi:MAG: transposase [Caldilineaceae bacterium]|nr:transposase [Caldilineaceae bacterium]
MKIHEGMADDSVFLSGIVEADETFVVTAGSRQHDEDVPLRRGRGTEQQPVLGALARGGKVVAKPSEKATGKTLKAFRDSVVG